MRLVASRLAVEGCTERYPLSEMEIFQPDKHKSLLAAGRLHEETGDNRIIMRFYHSPGFFSYPLLRAYADIRTNRKECDYHFLVNEGCYRAMLLREMEDEALDFFRMELISDPRVHRMEVDPHMLKVKEAAKKRRRVEGLTLLSLTWLLIDNDFSTFFHIAEFLSKKVPLNILLHPLTALNRDYFDKIKKMEGLYFQRVYHNLSHSELIDLYDEHENIVTDGSGSCYEAMVRGCNPYAIRTLRSVPRHEKFNETLEEEFLPFPDYREISERKYGENKEFLQRYYPYLEGCSLGEAEELATKEIASLIPTEI